VEFQGANEISGDLGAVDHDLRTAAQNEVPVAHEDDGSGDRQDRIAAQIDVIPRVVNPGVVSVEYPSVVEVVIPFRRLA